ncbi:hypothetical protein IFM58399_04731 [Aspergillus lentulus]|uniref:Serine hydrolase domain-containing protein n=1 Tax=Aspergillus lentulus TaxID=293939 RepID=A0ABQ1A2D6_ASPLE|nr:uncharacterized protein IFM58399_04731 [Aspergillus lentulus]GFF36969.1 hypothetical protein IFM58399_04731 [Aspergillus lentulus]GFF58821.1 hypothetical protein IFM62136_03942 [Aspergillus lentulus]GFF71713.1 hypothetical protein IFM60648_03496 [Aspergillus lentulus]GFF81043.1 hypothetical protein IFM47457_05347 [Aspergillus lentulus]GFG03361.1 hypothetical protein IFM61392_02769 [Aspergillus lentulus]
MKILCLHPWGTSAVIFEKQISNICSLIGETHNYVFVDGPVRCGPAKGLPAIEKGPFYSWYEGLSCGEVKTASDLVWDIIDEEGPFDGVIGFSQGASLALSILYHHQINRPHQPPPFRFAVFLCSVLSISPDPKFNADIIDKYSRYYKSSVEPGLEDNMANISEEDDEVEEEKNSKMKKVPKRRVMLLLPGQKRALANDVVGLVRQLSENAAGHDGTAQKLWKQRGGDEGFPRVYHPLVNKQRISIPTVHVIGRSDPLRRQSELQARLCNKSLARVVEISGGHRVPRTSSDLQSVAFAIEWAIRMAQLQ